jgi:hypothetical protein
LGWTGMMPWRLRRFLREVARHGLLTRSGSSVRFLHGLLFEHLARTDPLDAVFVPGPTDRDAPARRDVLRRMSSYLRAAGGEPQPASGATLVLRADLMPDVDHADGVGVRTDSSVRELFEWSGRALLIVGEADTRRTALLHLTSGLLDEAERDPAEPIPVVLRLNTTATTSPRRSEASLFRNRCRSGFLGRVFQSPVSP